MSFQEGTKHSFLLFSSRLFGRCHCKNSASQKNYPPGQLIYDMGEMEKSCSCLSLTRMGAKTAMDLTCPISSLSPYFSRSDYDFSVHHLCGCCRRFEVTCVVVQTCALNHFPPFYLFFTDSKLFFESTIQHSALVQDVTQEVGEFKWHPSRARSSCYRLTRCLFSLHYQCKCNILCMSTVNPLLAGTSSYNK